MQTIRQWLNTWLENSKIPKSKRPGAIKALRAEFEQLKELTLPLETLPAELISQLRIKIDEISKTLKRPRKLKPGINRRKNGRRIWVDRKTEQEEKRDEDDDDDDCDR
jgi:hypothetical protein